MDSTIQFFKSCGTWVAESLWVLFTLGVYITLAFLLADVDGGPIILIGIVALSLLLTYRGWKTWTINHPTAHTGVSVAVIVATFIITEVTMIGYAFVPDRIAIIGAATGFALAVYPAVFAGGAVWNAGINDIPTYHLGLLRWLGANQTYLEQEWGRWIDDEWHEGEWVEKSVDIPAGFAWLLPFFISYQDFLMMERTTELKPITVEVKDGSLVTIEPTFQWKVQAGQLHYFGNVENVERSFSNEAAKAAGALAIACPDIEAFVASRPRESLERVIYHHTNLRADGQIHEISIPVDRTRMPEFVRIIDKTTGEPQRADPWGIDIISAPIKDYKLPENYTRAASEIAEAAARKAAAVSLKQNLTETREELAQGGVDPNAALAQAHAVVMDDRPNPHHVVTIPGLSKIGDALMEFVRSRA